ncbi:hypothetical protein UlMin_027223 [Ulmus minor]
MSVYDAAFVNSELSKPTSIFGPWLWVVVEILVGSLIILTLFLLSICITSYHWTKHKSNLSKPTADANTLAILKEIQEIIGKPQHRVVVFSNRALSRESRGTMMSGCETASFGSGNVGPEFSHLGWGRWYTLRELEAATNGLYPKNVIGEGGYGIVYSGILGDGTKVAVKNLLNNRGQAEREFKVEVEVIRRVRHKNLVRLLGYCVKGAYSLFLTWKITLEIKFDVIHTYNNYLELMWGAFDDIVMGGVSESIFQIDRAGGEKGLFGLSSSSVVSTENNAYGEPKWVCLLILVLVLCSSFYYANFLFDVVK